MPKKHFLFLLTLTIGCYLYADLDSQIYTNARPATPFSHLEFSEIASFNEKSYELEAQSPRWSSEMAKLGSRISDAGVRKIYLVHGTFAGNDPLGVLACIQCIYPDLDPGLAKQIRELIKKSNDDILRDAGNYLPEYATLLQQALGEIPCELFNWSSGNYHLARLLGTIRLAKKLAIDIDAEKITAKDRILLIGHSHAGQLFALLSNFLVASQGTDEVLKIAATAGEDTSNFAEIMAKVANVQLDIVTFGTPPRYGWGKGNYRLLNIINHRGEGHLAGNILGLLVTRDGDYVQQWGIAGTDLLASTPEGHKWNKQLDDLLGTGHNVPAWLKNAQAKMRVPQYGQTLLVDYQDNSTFLPNCVAAFFGHGVYTKFDKMLFNTHLIVTKLYQ